MKDSRRSSRCRTFRHVHTSTQIWISDSELVGPSRHGLLCWRGGAAKAFFDLRNNLVVRHGVRKRNVADSRHLDYFIGHYCEIGSSLPVFGLKRTVALGPVCWPPSTWPPPLAIRDLISPSALSIEECRFAMSCLSICATRRVCFKVAFFGL